MKSKSTEGLINHFGSVRIRLNGTGNLKLNYYSLDDSISETLVTLSMSSAPGKEILQLSNFTTQRASLQIRTTEIDEVFKISKIVVYAKSVASGYPQ